VLADFGVTAAVKKRLSEHGGDNTATLSTAALVKTVLISLIVGGILLGSGWINGYLGATLASWLALSIVVQEASVLAINVLQGELRVAESAVIRSVRRVVWVVIGFWLVVRGWGIHGVVAGYIAGFAVVAVVGWARASTRLGRPRRDQLSSLFAYAKYNSVSRLGSYSYNWLDIAVLGLFVSQASIGIYEYAWQVTLPLVFISRALGSVMFPQLSHWNSEMSTERIESVVSRSLAAAQFFLIPAFAGCVMLSEDIFRFVFHESSTVGPLVLIILSFEKTVQSSAAIIRRARYNHRPRVAACGARSPVRNRWCCCRHDRRILPRERHVLSTNICVPDYRTPRWTRCLVGGLSDRYGRNSTRVAGCIPDPQHR
jgi:O-antigen/teichoic acid export membrane protein